jgi:hypothetical protein
MEKQLTLECFIDISFFVLAEDIVAKIKTFEVIEASL